MSERVEGAGVSVGGATGVTGVSASAPAPSARPVGKLRTLKVSKMTKEQRRAYDQAIKKEQKERRMARMKAERDEAVRINLPAGWQRPQSVSGCAAAEYKARELKDAPGMSAGDALRLTRSREAQDGGSVVGELEAVPEGSDRGEGGVVEGMGRGLLRSAATAVRKARAFIDALERPDTTGSQFVRDNYREIAESGVCRVCRDRVDGCPCCWEFKEEQEEEADFDPYNLSAAAAQRMDNRFSLEGPLVGTKVVCTHTDLVNHEEIRRHHWKFAFVDVIVKTLPTGDEVRFRMASHWNLDYLYFQYRNNAGYAGTDDKVELLMPTEQGVFTMSTLRRLHTARFSGVDMGKRTLRDYHCRDHNTFVSLFRVSFIHDKLTAGTVEAFFRQNFTVEPWRYDIQHYMDELPEKLPGKDRAQNYLSPWLVKAMEIKHGWALEDAAKAKREAEDKKHAADMERQRRNLEKRRLNGTVKAKAARRTKRQQLAKAREQKLEEEKARRAMVAEEQRQREVEAELKRIADEKAAELEARRRKKADRRRPIRSRDKAKNDKSKRSKE